MKKKYYIYIIILLLIIAIPITFIIYNKEKVKNQSKQSEIVFEKEDGTIYVEAGEGILKGGGHYSYIGESARGLEAYLAEKDASATYTVNSDKKEIYTLWVKLSDDGIHPDSTRDATIIVNETQKLLYEHFSEDTKGWKWYEIGKVELNKGENTIVFIKNKITSGSYVMDEFKLVPESKDK